METQIKAPAIKGEILDYVSGPKSGVITYQNVLGEYWTAATINGELTDIMLKGNNLVDAMDKHNRWVGYLDLDRTSIS